MSDRSGRASVPHQLIYPYYLSNDINKQRYMYEKFSGQPFVFRTASTVAAFPTAAQGQTDFCLTPKGNYFEMFQTTAQTLNPAYTGASGLEIGLDQVDNESVEYVLGGNNVDNPFAFTVGTDPNFFFRATLKFDDASGSDQTVIGFRKQQAFGVPVSFLSGGDATYTDFFAAGFCAAKADPNPVGAVSSVGHAVNVQQALNFTWADGKYHTIEIRVVGGKPLVLINGVLCGDVVSKDGKGAAITAQTTVSGPSYTFTSGLVVLPFIFSRQDTDLTDNTWLYDVECGLLRDIGKDKNAENARINSVDGTA